MSAHALASPVDQPRGISAKAQRKTFPIKAHGGTLRVRQFGRFSHQIEGRTFQFVVTANPHNPALPAVVTHAISGKKLCSLPLGTARNGDGDFSLLARFAINSLLRDCGAERVAKVLIDAEAEAAKGNRKPIASLIARTACLLLAVFTAAGCVKASPAVDTPADLIFIAHSGVQLSYRCEINLLRQWPAGTVMTDAVLAHTCTDALPVGGVPSLSKRAGQSMQNISDRAWTATLMSEAGDTVYSDCQLVSLAIDQGSTTLSLNCATVR